MNSLIPNFLWNVNSVDKGKYTLICNNVIPAQQEQQNLPLGPVLVRKQGLKNSE